TVTGNTKLSFKLLSSLPGSAMLPQVGTDFKLLWNFTAQTVNPNDNNSIFGSVPTLTLENNRINLESFFKAFAGRALDQIDQATDPLQGVIDVLTLEIPLLSDLGSDAVTILDILGVDPSTVAALGALSALIDLANFARTTSGNSSVFVDLGSYALGGDLRDDKLDDLPGALIRSATGSGNSALANFKNKAAAISGLAFPILDDANVAANLLLGRNATLFTWRSGEIEFSEQFQQFFPVLGPVGITLGGHVGLKTQFGFGYDTQGVFDFYSGGSANSDLLNNGFFASALDEMGQPLTGITLSAGITAGIAANIVIASVGVEGDLTATVGIYLDSLLGDAQGRVRGQTLLNTPLTKLFYASGSLSAGLRAYLEVGLTPFSVSFDFESPRVTLISFDTQADQTPVLGNFHAGDNELVLNVGDRASFRLHGDLEDRAEEFFVGNSSSGGVTVFAFNAKNDFPLPSLIVANGNLRGDSLTTAADMNVPVHFTGGPGFDKLTGGGGNDLLEGGDGPDNLTGRGGNDTLLGGADNDELNGGDGFDTLDGGPGLDTASWVGSSIALVMDLRTGFFGGAAVGDTLISIERYEGTTHDDTMDGSEGDDSLLRGEAGNDTIRGHGGRDQLEGGEGNDILEGGDG
ncbi:MAG: calcium-binding protein, partial [Verrucomicrobiota bacterium]